VCSLATGRDGIQMSILRMLESAENYMNLLLVAPMTNNTELTNQLPKEIGIGGNHLASAMLSEGIYPAAERHTSYDDFLERYGQPWADIFIAWKAIMDWRDGKLSCEYSAESEK